MEEIRSKNGVKKKERSRETAYVVIAALSAIVISLCLIIYLNLSDADAKELCATLKSGPEKSTACIRALWHSILEHIATALFIFGVWHSLEQGIFRREWNAEILSRQESIRKEITELQGETKKEIILQQDAMKKEIMGRMAGVSEGALSGIDTANQEIKDSLEEIERRLRLASRDEMFGLEGTYPDAYKYDMSEEIRSSEEFVAVMATGSVWLNRHLDAFRDRFSKPNLKTTIILIHPESDQIDAVSRKNKLSKEYYKQDIELVIGQLTNLPREGVSNLKIMGHKLVSCHAIYIAGKKVVFLPYFLSSERREPPVLVLRDAGENSFFDKVLKDVKALEKESFLLYPGA